MENSTPIKNERDILCKSNSTLRGFIKNEIHINPFNDNNNQRFYNEE